MSEIKKTVTKQESMFNKTMGSPGGFGSSLGSPARPSTQGALSSMSPNKKSSYGVNNLDDANETAKRLRDKLEEFKRQRKDPHQTQDVLFGCLNDMLCSVSLTKDKRLQ